MRSFKRTCSEIQVEPFPQTCVQRVLRLALDTILGADMPQSAMVIVRHQSLGTVVTGIP